MAERAKSSRGRDIAHIICLALIAAVFECFFVLALAYFRGRWEDHWYFFALILGTLFNAAILTVDYISYFMRRQLIYRSCLIAYIFLIFVAVIAYALFKTGFAEVIRDEEKFKEYLEQAGSWMTALFITLQFLQVVILPIPSTVTVVAGSALFGPLYGSLYSLIGILIGSVVAFLIGRYAGFRVVAWIVGEETLEKWLKKIKGKDKLFLTAMFLLPVFPDDVLCFVAGLSSMSLLYFVIVILLSRIFAIFSTSYSITLIPFNTWWGLMIWAILFVLVVLLFVFLYKKSDAILSWCEKIFHRETRVEHKVEKDEFSVEIVDSDGSIVKKGVKKEGEKQEPPSSPEQKE